MLHDDSDFTRRYGRWAVVAGASEGLGAAFAHALARRRQSLVLLARRADVLGALADRLRDERGVEVRTLAIDLAEPGLGGRLREACADLEIGVGVYNAAYSPIGDFLDLPEEELTRVADVNVRGPLVFARTLAPAMVERGRGGLVVMSSLAGLQGSPRITTYAASKAFDTILAEGLYAELGERGVDVVACLAGAIRTPGYAASAKRDSPGMLDPEVVAEAALNGLGDGPRVVPGWINRIASVANGKVLSRRAAIRLMAANTRGLG